MEDFAGNFSFVSTFSRRVRAVLTLAAVAFGVVNLVAGAGGEAPDHVGFSVVVQHAAATRDCPVIGC